MALEHFPNWSISVQPIRTLTTGGRCHPQRSSLASFSSPSPSATMPLSFCQALLVRSRCSYCQIQAQGHGRSRQPCNHVVKATTHVLCVSFRLTFNFMSQVCDHVAKATTHFLYVTPPVSVPCSWQPHCLERGTIVAPSDLCH